MSEVLFTNDVNGKKGENHSKTGVNPSKKLKQSLEALLLMNGGLKSSTSGLIQDYYFKNQPQPIIKQRYFIKLYLLFYTVLNHLNR